MKKNIFKMIKTFAFLVAVLAFASCGNLFSSIDDDDDDSSSSSSSGISLSAGKSATVTFNFSTASRTALPSVELSSYTYTLTATDSSGTESTLLEKQSLTGGTLSASVKGGTYTFTITAYSDDTAVLTGSTSAKISSTAQTVSISLKAAAGGTGSVSVSLKIAESLGVSSVKAGLYDEITSTDSGSELELDTTTNLGYTTVTYSNSSVASGVSKYVIFFLYDSSSNLITSYVESVYVVNGLTSSSERIVDTAVALVTVTVQKDGSDWADSGLEINLVTESGSEIEMTATSGAATYTANISASDGECTVYVGGISKGNTVEYSTSTAPSVTLSYDSDAVYPNMETTSAYADTYLELTFDSAPTINRASEGTVRIYKTDGTLVDTIKPAAETLTCYGSGGKSGIGSINAQYQLIQVVDTNKVRIIPHHNSNALTLLSNSTGYYVEIDDGLISGTLNGSTFNGVGKGEWTFTTAGAPSVSGSTLTVGTDKNFVTVQGALSYLMSNSKTGDWEIDIDTGTYYERIFYSGSANIVMSGQGNSTYGSDVVIQWTNQDGGSSTTLWNNGSRGRNVFYFAGGDLILENLSIVNTATRKTNEYGEHDDSGSDTANNNNQAEALMFDSTETAAAYNCTFTSKQDTLYLSPKGGKAWVYGCQISGDVDFLWGLSDVALFEKCDIISLYDSDKSSNHVSYVVASHLATSSAPYGKGFVVFNSTITNQSGQTTYLARSPWGTDENVAQVAIVNTSVSGGLGSGSTYWYGNHVGGDDETILGWKSYGITVDGNSLTDSTYGMGSSMYNAEFTGRRNILNRVYNGSEFEKDTTSHWDVDSLISKRSWAVDDDSSSESGSVIADYGSTISDSDSYARNNTLTVIKGETPSGYAGVDYASSYGKSSYTNTVTVTSKSDLVSYASKGGYFIIVDGMIDMSDGMLPSNGGGTNSTLDSFVNTTTSSSYATYPEWVAAYAAACSLTSDDETSGSSNSSLFSTLWTLSDAYKEKIQLVVASNTAIVGANSSSGIKGGTISISGASNVVLRNLIIQDAYDPFPHHEVKSDGTTSDGYNAQHDGVTIQGDSSYIWIDHCTFEDTMTLGHVYTSGNASDTYLEKWQTYDGLLDIKGTSKYITVSYNKFKNHDKTSLIGSSDVEDNTASDRLITYHHNYFYNCGQRLPMMRNGTFHLYNNYYAYSSGEYTQQYAFGIRSGSTVYSENNYFDSGIKYAYSADSSSVGTLYASGDSGTINKNKVSSSGSTKFSSAVNDYTYDTETDAVSSVPSLAGNGEVTIKDSADQITVTFNKNADAASITTTNQTVSANVSTALTSADSLGLSYTEAEFKGWAASADSTDVAYEDGESVTFASDTTLYAVWLTVTLSDSYTVDLSSSETVSAAATASLSSASVTYESLDENVFTVASDGSLTGVGIGKATLTATSGNASATATIVVKRTTPIESMAFDFRTGAIVSGSSASSYDYGVISGTETSLNGKQHGIAVSNGGTLVIKVAGSSTIYIGNESNGGGGTWSAVKTSDSSTDLTSYLSATTYTTASSTIDTKYTTLDDTSKASSQILRYTGSEAATITLTMSATAYFPVIWVEYYEVPSVTVTASFSSSSATLDLNGTKTSTQEVTYTVSDGATPTVAYSSSQTSVATVDSNGQVTAVGMGVSVITATVTSSTDSTASASASYYVVVKDSSTVSADYLAVLSKGRYYDGTSAEGSGKLTFDFGYWKLAPGSSNAYQYSSGHGIIFKTGNSVTLTAKAGSTIKLTQCAYDNAHSITVSDGTNAITDATCVLTSAKSTGRTASISSGVISVTKPSTQLEGDYITITIPSSYTGDSVVLTWTSNNGSVYVHQIDVTIPETTTTGSFTVTVE